MQVPRLIPCHRWLSPSGFLRACDPEPAFGHNLLVWGGCTTTPSRVRPAGPSSPFEARFHVHHVEGRPEQTQPRGMHDPHAKVRPRHQRRGQETTPPGGYLHCTSSYRGQVGVNIFTRPEVAAAWPAVATGGMD